MTNREWILYSLDNAYDGDTFLANLQVYKDLLEKMTYEEREEFLKKPYTFEFKPE